MASPSTEQAKRGYHVAEIEDEFGTLKLFEDLPPEKPVANALADLVDTSCDFGSVVFSGKEFSSVQSAEYRKVANSKICAGLNFGINKVNISFVVDIAHGGAIFNEQITERLLFRDQFMTDVKNMRLSRDDRQNYGIPSFDYGRPDFLEGGSFKNRARTLFFSVNANDLTRVGELTTAFFEWVDKHVNREYIRVRVSRGPAHLSRSVKELCCDIVRRYTGFHIGKLEGDGLVSELFKACHSVHVELIECHDLSRIAWASLGIMTNQLSWSEPDGRWSDVFVAYNGKNVRIGANGCDIKDDDMVRIALTCHGHYSVPAVPAHDCFLSTFLNINEAPMVSVLFVHPSVSSDPELIEMIDRILHDRGFGVIVQGMHGVIEHIGSHVDSDHDETPGQMNRGKYFRAVYDYLTEVWPDTEVAYLKETFDLNKKFREANDNLKKKKASIEPFTDKEIKRHEELFNETKKHTTHSFELIDELVPLAKFVGIEQLIDAPFNRPTVVVVTLTDSIAKNAYKKKDGLSPKELVDSAWDYVARDVLGSVYMGCIWHCESDEEVQAFKKLSSFGNDPLCYVASSGDFDPKQAGMALSRWMF